VAGEASGDLHGARLAAEMKILWPGVTIRGMGGHRMASEGVEILVSCSDVAVVGLTEVFMKLPALRRALAILKSELELNRPDLLVLIDYPDFNLHLAGFAGRLGIPVLYYIGPQVWAWRRGRIRKIARRVTRMAVILPFEEDYYKRRGVNARYVGHPLMDASSFPALEAREDLRLEEPLVGLIPGSRREEVIRLLPSMVKAGELMKRRFPDISFVLPLAESIPIELVKTYLSKSNIHVDVLRSGIYEALRRCHVAMVASGTATLETAIMGVPMVIAYRVSSLSYLVGRLVIKVPFIGLVNLVAGEKAVPELIQHEVSPGNLAMEAARLLEDDSLRRRTIEKLAVVKKSLGGSGASRRAAEIAIHMLGSRPGSLDFRPL